MGSHDAWHAQVHALLAQFASTKDVSFRNQALELCTPFVGAIASKLLRRLPVSVQKGDLVSVGFLALLDCVEAFDPSRNILFVSFAEHRVRGAMIDFLRKDSSSSRSFLRQQRFFLALESKLGRTPTPQDCLAEDPRLSLEEWSETLLRYQARTGDRRRVSLDTGGFEGSPIDVAQEIDEFPRVDDRIMAEKLRVLMVSDLLSSSEKLTLEFYFFSDYTLLEISEFLGCVESRASQYLTSGLRKLRRALDPNSISLSGLLRRRIS